MSITTIVFDAYGTLFDVAGAARQAASEPGGAALAQLWPKLAEDWRRKQLEYTWLRAVSGIHAPFDEVTANALDWALEAQNIADPALRSRLLALYEALPAYPEAVEVLSHLKATGYRLAVLSNGTPGWLASTIGAAGLNGCFDAVLSVEETRIYKPAWQVYDLVEHHFAVAPQRVLFVSSNGWDVAGAARFGFWTAWVNRANLPEDRMPQRPAFTLRDLSGIPACLS